MKLGAREAFAISCVTDLSNTREGQRLVVMRKFLNDGLGADIGVLLDFSTEDYQRVGLIVIVEAASKEIVQDAISFCDGVFHTRVDAVTVRKHDTTVTALPRYAAFSLKTPIGAKTESKLDSCDTTEARVWLEFQGDAIFNDVVLIDTPTFASAHALGTQLVPGTVIETHYCQTLRDLFARKTTPQPRDVAPPSRPVAETATTPGAIYSAKRNAAYAVLNSPMPFDVNMNMQIAPKDQPCAVSGPAMVWFLVGPNNSSSFAFSVKWSWVNNFWPPNYVYSTASNWGLPDGVIPSSSNGLTYQFDPYSTPPIRGSVRSELSMWLNELMMTPKFDQTWPEDAYTGGKLKAYEFILSKLPGSTPPNKGTLKEPGRILVIDYPAGADFTQEDFKAVKDHLVLEVGYFVTVDNWFAVNGIMDAINRGIAILSANDLTEAANYMQIPVKQTNVTMVLDEIFGVVFGFLSAIPGAGSAISAVANMAWTIVKAALPDGPYKTPIQAAIAEIADQLNGFLINLETAAEIQRQKLYKNWGKLHEFSDGVITGKISQEMFFSDTGQLDEMLLDGAPNKLHQRVQANAADAWLFYSYQRLFTVAHQVTASLSFTQQSPPPNPWNPANGEYRYSWSIPCVYTNGKNGDVSGYMVIDCQTDAPAIVMQQLFGSTARLPVIPFEFFASLNGWRTGTITWDAGYQNTTGHAPFVPVKQIGLKSWGDVLRTDG